MKLPPGYVPGSGVHKASGFGGFGERLLRKQGWQKGEGLGKDKTGRVEAIEVKKKEDTVGVRSPESLYTALKKKAEDSDSDTDSDISTVDGVVVASQNCDGTITSAQQHELAIAAELAKQPAWFGGGRFSGREGKMARIRQQEALAAAKLGLACPKVDLVPPAAVAKASKKRKASLITEAVAQLPAQTTAVQVAATEASSSKKKKGKKPKATQDAVQIVAASSGETKVPAAEPQPARKRVVVEPAFTPAPAAPFVQTPSSGWWGAKKFASAGCLEGAEQEKEKAAAQRQQFNEDDQTNLYMAAHNLKTQNKKGLGTKSHIGKVAGAKWEGSKTVFDDAAASNDDTGSDPVHQPGQQTQNSASAVAPSVANTLLPDIKWKKLATAELLKADRRQLKTKQLHKTLVQHAMSKHNLAEDWKAHLSKQVADKLNSSSKFSVLGKVTTLSA